MLTFLKFKCSIKSHLLQWSLIGHTKAQNYQEEKPSLVLLTLNGISGTCGKKDCVLSDNKRGKI